MTFCPRCGAPLTAGAQVPPPYPQQRVQYRNEKSEKQEKNEPEKGEKHEKGEFGYVGWLIGGFILIVLGLFAIAGTVGFLNEPTRNALMLLIIGVAVIVVAIFLSTRARKRYPPTP